MTGIHDLPLFVAAGLLLNLTPGPDMAYIATRSASGGLRDGVAAVIGVTAGCLVHTLAAALGLSALLATPRSRSTSRDRWRVHRSPSGSRRRRAIEAARERVRRAAVSLNR